jgi:hypothetical protein
MTPPLSFTFDDETQDKPRVPTVQNPLPASFTFDDEADVFPRQPGPQEPPGLRQSIAGNVFSGILPAAFNMVHEAVAVPPRTVWGLGDAYDELRAGKTPPNKFSAALASPLVSYLNASTRNVPEAERNAAKAQTAASAIGGLGGMGAGALTGAGIGALGGPPGMAAGAVVGGLVGGLGGGVYGSRYGREELQEAKLMPEDDQWEEDKRDISEGIIGSLLLPLNSVHKSFKGNKATNRVQSAGEAQDRIYRGTNPGALQTQALAGTADDTIFRAPRSDDVEPFNPPQIDIENIKGPLPVENIFETKGIDRAATNVDINNITSVTTTNKPGDITVAGYEKSLEPDGDIFNQRQLDSNPDNLPAIRDNSPAIRDNSPAIGNDNPALQNGEPPALYTPEDMRSDMEFVDTEVVDPYRIPDEVLARKKPVILPGKKERKPGQYYLDQALNEPGMDMIYDRDSRGSEFDTLAPYAKSRIVAGKEKVNKVFSELPEEARIPVGKAVFGNVEKLLEQAGVPQGARTPYYDVWYAERGGLAPLFLGGDDNSPHIQEYRRLLNKQKSSERGGARAVGDTGQFMEKLTPQERQKLDAFDAQIDNHNLTFAEADRLKSHFAELASRKYEKGSTSMGSDDKANRALVHQAMADGIRNQIESGVKYYAPDKFKEFQSGNRESQIYFGIEKLSKKRAADDKFYGRNKLLDQFDRPVEPTMWGSLLRIGNGIKDKFIPEPETREQMLRQADATPFNGGTGFKMFNSPEWANRFFQTSEKINKAIGDYQKLTTSRGEVPNIFGDPIRKNRIKDANPADFNTGIEGIQAGRAASDDKNTGYEILDKKVGPWMSDRVQQLYSPEREPYTKPPAAPTPSAIGKLSSVLGAINPFGATTAMAEELPMAPRDDAMGGLINEQKALFNRGMGEATNRLQQEGVDSLYGSRLPRNTESFTTDHIASFMMQNANSPKAPIAQQLVAKLKEAAYAQDMDKVERLHADMARIFPESFEQGTGINGKVFYPDEQTKVMDNLRELHRQGQIDSIHLAKQRNAFMNPMDSRILPVTPLRTPAQAGPNRMVNGTRTYGY